MVLTDKELKKLHEKQLNILKEFIKICNELKLRYYLIGGSAIGAVRHHGFIPWDDDIDVAMSRKDYEIFLEKAQKMLPQTLFVQTMDTDKNYRNHFAKIRDSKTTFIEEIVKKVDMNHGIYLDIFPIDGIGNTQEEALKNFHSYSVLNEIYYYKLGRLSKKGMKNKIRNVYYFFKSLKYKDIFQVENKIQKFCKNHNYDDYDITATYFGGNEKEIFYKDVYGEGITAIFEGIDVVLPSKYDEYLTQIYGKYMELPPKEERVAKHCYILDTEKSYKEYQKSK